MGGSRRPVSLASSSRERWPPCALRQAGCPLRRPQGDASSPVFLCPSGWSRSFRPPGARTAAEPKDARDQSMRSACPRRSSTAPCSRSHTPASCHSRSLRQQVMPEPQPISCGSISQGMPVLSTNRMPVRTARLSMRGLPPLGFGVPPARAALRSPTTLRSPVLWPCSRPTRYPVLLGALSLRFKHWDCGSGR